MRRGNGDLSAGSDNRIGVGRQQPVAGARPGAGPKSRMPVRRALLAVERVLLLEDLKYAGVPVAVLRSLVAKLDAGQLPERGPGPGGPALGPEEREAGRLLEEWLSRMGVLLPGPSDPGAAVQGGRPIIARLTHLKWREPADELRGTADLAAQLLGEDPDLLPRDILIVAPGPAQCGAVGEELARRRLSCQYIAPLDAVHGDPRRPDRQGTLGAYAALALAADLRDCAAWRLWLSLGQADFGCACWSALLDLAREGETDVATVLMQLAGEVAGEAAGAVGGRLDGGGCVLAEGDMRAQMASRARDALELAGTLAAKRGFALRGALEARCPHTGLPQLFDRIDGGDDAAALRDAMRGQSYRPTFGGAPEAVHLCTYARTPLFEARHRYVFAIGLVDGLVPPAIPKTGPAGRAECAETPSGFPSLLANAADEAFVSCFQRADGKAVERFHLPAGRTRRCQGREMSFYVQSRLLAALGDVLPGSVSAEQYLAQRWGA